MADDEPPLQPVATGYKNVIRVQLAIASLLLVAVSLILNAVLLSDTPANGLVPLLALALAAAMVVLVPDRKYRRLRYRLTDRTLQVVRGWVFHADTVVPLVRVQHLDVVRGPLDKLFGTAALVVHTAGTHNSIVTLPGLEPDRAVEIRDIVREHVRTDFA